MSTPLRLTRPTIRDMETNDVEMRRFDLGHDPFRKVPSLDRWPVELVPYRYTLAKMIEEANTYLKTPFVLEFSIYPKPIGRRGERIIYWEVIT